MANEPTPFNIKLSPSLARAVEHIAQRKNLTPEQIIQGAVQHYLQSLENAALHRLESHFVRALDDQTARLGAMLAKVAVDNRTIVRMLSQQCTPEYTDYCRAQAINTIVPVLTKHERHHYHQLSELSRAQQPPDAQHSQT
jgi:hypothetical protein